MDTQTRVAVTSRSFSNNPILRDKLLAIYPQTTFNETGTTLRDTALIAFLKDHDKAILGLERLTADVVAQLPSLKVISRFGVGVDTLDVAAIKQRGIRLATANGANKRAVAELVLAFAMTMLRKLPTAYLLMREGNWQQIKGARQLTGKTVGIIGFGAIGQDLKYLLQPFACRVLTYDVIGDSHVTLDKLLQESDIVSVHLPLNETTQHFLDAKQLNLMKLDAILINTSRGGIVNEQALKERLKQHPQFSAALDVFATEPPEDSELLQLPNFFATPHLAGTTEEAILAIGLAAIAGLQDPLD